MRLKEKVCLITNAGDYMGPATVKEFQREGAILYVHGKDGGKVREMLERFEVDLSAISLLEADIGSPDGAQKIAEKVSGEKGRIDVLVNVNSHPPGGSLVHETEEAFWRSMFHRLVDELFFMCKAVLPFMIEARRGKIVNFTSSAGVRGMPKYATYSAARFAANGFTQALGREVARYNIQVNAIAQNYVENPQYYPDELIANPEILAKIQQKIPLGRLAKGWESARLAVFLASEESDFLCGEVIRFTGGGD
ncbi:MAG: hypothetical protein BAA01_05305 [Bacillus thermozeamaize]|uniref:Short-chain dehydrogenase n=1 Tax=Bacillus thermozeamaize TaxID=230954 RepID=A0A1Y3PTP9_9BACI|nr:MAG: hypothetical protein BAA01_05305 [Bacillus thermozeamaize]